MMSRFEKLPVVLRLGTPRGRQARNASNARSQSASFISVDIDGSLQIRQSPKNHQEKLAGILLKPGESIRPNGLRSNLKVMAGGK